MELASMAVLEVLCAREVIVEVEGLPVDELKLDANHAS